MGLAAELTRKVEGALASNDWREVKAAADWAYATFRFDSSKTPRGQKKLKEEASRFFGALRDVSYGVTPKWFEFLTEWWERFKRDVDDLVQHFSAEGDQARGVQEQVVELKLSNATYFNRSGMSEATFRKYAKVVEATLADLKGWRKRALKGNLKVVFVGAQQMRVQGKYREALDEMWVKATPKVLKRSGGTYGSPEYILVHELGHRYEKFNSLPTVDFDRGVEWRTTRYSWNDGETFAELFALSQFNIKGQWGDKLDRFEDVMARNVKVAEKAEDFVAAGVRNHAVVSDWWESLSVEEQAAASASFDQQLAAQKADDEAMMTAMASRVAATYTKQKPSYPHRTDRASPTNANLWRDVLAVASGDRRELRIGDRTIHAPNEGRGYRNMPNNPQGISWAVKQYKGFGGGWKEASEAMMDKVEFQERVGRILDAGGVMAIPHANEQERLWMARLAHSGYAQQAGENERETLWVRMGVAKVEDISSGGISFLTKVSKGGKGKFNLDHVEDALKPLGFQFEEYVTVIETTGNALYYWWKKQKWGKPWAPLAYGVAPWPTPRYGARYRFETRADAEQALREVEKMFVAVPAKGPSAPKKGAFYAKWARSPFIQPFEGGFSVEMDIDKIFFGVAGWRVTSPEGGRLDIPSVTDGLAKVRREAIEFPRFWTFLYKKCGAQALAEQALAKIGAEAVEAAQPKPKNLRDLSNTGTCGVCEQNVKLTGKGGTLARHGWQVGGTRYKGSYGGSWHTGPCQGTGYLPWELSDQAVKAYLKELRERHLPAREAELVRLKSRPEKIVVLNRMTRREDEYLRDASDPKRQSLYELHLQRLTREAEAAVGELKAAVHYYDEKLQGWAEQPLPGKK